MPRNATGQILRMDGGEGGGKYALRYRHNGKRIYRTLGTLAEGWDDDKARAELDRVMEEVRTGTHRPEGSSLRDIVREVVDGAPHDLLNDPDGLSMAVIERAGEDAIMGEILVLVRAMVHQIVGADIRHAVDSPKAEELDLNAVVKPAGDAKRLGDCTVADVDTIAYEREQRAKDLLGVAAGWRSLAREMRETSAKTVSDLGAQRALAALRRGKPYKVLRTDELTALAS